jgi:hypothetical protein
MKKKQIITLDTMDHKRKSFWSDCNDVRKKLEKRDMKNQTKAQDYCIHTNESKTRQ